MTFVDLGKGIRMSRWAVRAASIQQATDRQAFGVRLPPSPPPATPSLSLPPRKTAMGTHRVHASSNSCLISSHLLSV